MRIGYTTQFKRNLIQLSRRYRHVRSDVQPLIETLAAGEMPGDQVPGVGLPVYKVRVRNSDAHRGKSGGYRCLYYVVHADHVVLVTIYSKSDITDIPAHELRRLIEEHRGLQER